MGILDLLRGSDINQGIETWKQTPGAMLLDVRSDEEYRQGHIPGSINMPLIEMRNFSSKVPDTNTPIFAYCLSGQKRPCSPVFKKDRLHKRSEHRRHHRLPWQACHR